MDIQNSSKIGGSFHYAPDLPFIERHYTDEKGTFMKTRFSAIVDFHQIKDEIIIPQNVRIVWHLPAREYEYDVGSIESIYFK